MADDFLLEFFHLCRICNFVSFGKQVKCVQFRSGIASGQAPCATAYCVIFACTMTCMDGCKLLPKSCLILARRKKGGLKAKVLDQISRLISALRGEGTGSENQKSNAMQRLIWVEVVRGTDKSSCLGLFA